MKKCKMCGEVKQDFEFRKKGFNGNTQRWRSECRTCSCKEDHRLYGKRQGTGRDLKSIIKTININLQHNSY